MAVAPRDAAISQAPIRYSPVRGAENVRESFDAAERVDQFFCHAPLSQIVSLKASPKSHILCVEMKRSLSQTVTMADVDKNGGENFLKAWREHAKLTQAQLAEKVGTNSNMIGYLETGERGLSLKWLRRLAPALDINAGMLAQYDPADLSDDIIEIWAKASNRDRKRLVELAKLIVENDAQTGTNG